MDAQITVDAAKLIEITTEQANEAEHPEHAGIPLGTVFMGVLVGSLVPETSFLANVAAFESDPLYRKLVLDAFEAAKRDPMKAGMIDGADGTVIVAASVGGPGAMKKQREAMKSAGYKVATASQKRNPTWQEAAMDLLCENMVGLGASWLASDGIDAIRAKCASDGIDGDLPENVSDLSTLLAAIGKAQPGSMVDSCEIVATVKNGNPDPSGERVAKRVYVGFRLDVFNIYRNGESQSEGAKLVAALREAQKATREAVKNAGDDAAQIKAIKAQGKVAEREIKAQIRKLTSAK